MLRERAEVFEPVKTPLEGADDAVGVAGSKGCLPGEHPLRVEPFEHLFSLARASKCKDVMERLRLSAEIASGCTCGLSNWVIFSLWEIVLIVNASNPGESGKVLPLGQALGANHRLAREARISRR
jgi:hypothetical protein